MRGSCFIVLGAASHISCAYAQATYSTIPLRRTRRAWALRGGAGGESPRQTHTNSDADVPARWFRSRKRRESLDREVNAPGAREAVGGSSLGSRLGQGRHVLLAKGILRKLGNLLGAIIDIATLKRLRQLRQSRQSEWNHRGAIPARYWPLLQELRVDIAAEPGLERRARRVNHELDNVALGRYLQAAFWSLDQDGRRVSEFVKETIAWREAVGAHRIRNQDVAEHGAKGPILVKGHDLHRRPVVYFRPALDGKLEGANNSALMIYTLERAIRLMPRGSWQYTIVIDCKGMGLSHLPPLSYMKTMFKLLSHHYPMRLGNVLFTNVGPSVMLCWRVVSPMLQKRTKDKMTFIPSTKLEKTSKFIDPTQLLPFAGGRSPWIFDPESYFFNDASSL